MLEVEFSSQAKRSLKRAEKQLAKRLWNAVTKLAKNPFPKDVKRVVNKKDKIFRFRVGDYRIEYTVMYERNLLFITAIDKRPRAYH